LQDSDEGNCKILFDFLRLACTLNAAGDTASPAAGPELTTPAPDAALIRHRTTLVNSKLPGLNRVPTLQAGAEIVAALGGLVTEQRATRQDAREQACRRTNQDSRLVLCTKQSHKVVERRPGS
jgi:hypothetical protein